MAPVLGGLKKENQRHATKLGSNAEAWSHACGTDENGAPILPPQDRPEKYSDLLFTSDLVREFHCGGVRWMDKIMCFLTVSFSL